MSNSNSSPTLAELRKDAQSKGARLGRVGGPEAAAEALAATAAYRVVKCIDAASTPLTQEQADYICSVINTRVVAA